MKFNKKLTLSIVLIFSLFVQKGYSATYTTSDVDITQGQLGCYSIANCGSTTCREGCVDCDSAKECTSCEYGWFLYHTPQNTIECVKCPYFIPTSSDENNIHRCATCLEMPFQWEYIRSCTFKYQFPDNDGTKTPYNVTMNKPELFQVVVDLDTQQNTANTRYSALQLTPHCGHYYWKNYQINTVVTEELIEEQLSQLNDVTCLDCISGFLIDHDDGLCYLCSNHIARCSSCYTDPKTDQIACSICESQYTPNTDQDECISCSTQITNCTDCYFNSNHDRLECITCATNMRPSKDGTTCEPQNCSDPFCVQCSTADNVCEKCVNNYSVYNNACKANQTCVNESWSTSDCENCHSIIADRYSSGCLICDYFTNDGNNDYYGPPLDDPDIAGETEFYACAQQCPDGYGYNWITGECFSCTDTNIHPQAVPHCGNCEMWEGANSSQEYYCYECASTYGFNLDESNQVCVPCGTQCTECTVSGGSTTCYACDVAGYTVNEQTNACVQCSSEISNCTECYHRFLDPQYVFECTKCNVPFTAVEYDAVNSTASVCEIQCFSGCDTCLFNTKYKFPTDDETWYPSQKIHCTQCAVANNEFASLSQDGSTCYQNPINCRNALKFSVAETKSINFLFYQDQGDIFENAMCYSKCKLQNGSLNADQTLFLDPLSNKCTKCSNNQQKCRKTVVIRKFVYCQDGLTFHSDLSSFTPTAIGSTNLSDLLEFNFDFNSSPYSTWNDIGYTQFEFEVVFIGSSSDDWYNQCNVGEFNVEISSNIPSNIFRVNSMKFAFKTFDNDTGRYGGVNMNFNVWECNILVSSFIEFSMSNMNFIGGQYYSPEELIEIEEEGDYVTEFLNVSITMYDNLPNSRFILNSVYFQSNILFHLIPQFDLEDIGYFEVKDFHYTSVNTDSNQLTGFNLFNFRNYRGVTQFKMLVQDFELEDMLLENVILFNLPIKTAYAEIDQVTLTNVVFKNSYLVKDSSTGFGNGEIWLVFNNLTMSNCNLFDSTLIQVFNAQFFFASGWTFTNINAVLVDNLDASLIQSNVFIFAEITMTTIFLYNTNIFSNIISPSVIIPYFDYNQIIEFSLKSLTIYTQASSSLIDILIDNGAPFQAYMLQIDGVTIANGLKFNSDVKTYLANQNIGVYGIQNYVVTAMTTTSYPDTLITIRSNTVGDTVELQKFAADNLDKRLNVLAIYNANNLTISDFICTSTNPRQSQEGICLFAFGSDNLKRFAIKDGSIRNIIAEPNPLIIQNYQDIVIKNMDFRDMTVFGGVDIVPSGKATVVIEDCTFEQIITSLDLYVVVHSAALEIDLSNATEAQVTITQTTFNGIFARYQAAGLYLIDPSIKINVAIRKTLFHNVHSIDGGIIHGVFQSKDNVNFELSDCIITGAASNNYFDFKSLDGESRHDGESNVEIGDKKFYKNWTEQQDGEDGEAGQLPQDEQEKINQVIDGEGTFLTVQQLMTYAQNLLNAELDGEQVAEDVLVQRALLYPTAIRIENATVNIKHVIIEDIHKQQAMYLYGCKLTADQLSLVNNHCEQCSFLYEGSSMLSSTQFTITNSLFQDCSSYSGGALYVTSGTDTTNKGMNTISKSMFKNNKAIHQGAGIYIHDTFYTIADCQFTHNKVFGIVNVDDPILSVRGTGGGIYAQVSLGLTGSFTGRRFLDDTEMVVSGSRFDHNFAQYAASGKFVGQTVKFEDNKIGDNNKATIYGSDLINSCVWGEGQLSDGTCETCGEGKYSVSVGSSACVACQKFTTCDGADIITLDSGYWRSSNHSDIIEECYNKPENCLGGSGNFTCNTGQVGALCEACDLRGTTWGQKYSTASSYTCGACNDQAANAIKVTTGNLSVLISMILAVKGTLKIVSDKIQLKAIKHLFRQFRSDEDETGILIKMFTNYFQIISIIATFRINLPNTLIDTQDTVGNPVKSMGNALDCYLVEIQDNIPNLYFRIVWQLLMNALQFSIFVIGFAGLKLAKKTQIKFSSLMWTTFIYLLIYLQPSYVNAILEAVSCRDLGGYRWILADVQYMCDTDEYNTWTYYFLVPFLCFWVVLLPLWMFIMLYSNYKMGQLHKSHVLYKFGFIYQEYEDRVYYWELIKVFQKMLIVAIIQIYSQEIKVKAILVFMVVFTYGIISYFLKPYNNIRLNQIDIASSVVCSLSLIIGIFIYDNRFIYWEYFGFAVIILINFFFILYMIKQITRKMTNKMIKQHADKIEKAKKKIPALQKIVTATPESVQRGKNLWKKLAQRIELYQIGLKIGMIELVMPLEQEKKLDKYTSDDQKGAKIRGQHRKSSLAMFATFAADQEKLGKNDIDAKDAANKIQELNKMLSQNQEEDRQQDQLDLQDIQDGWDGEKFTSLQLLTGKLTNEELEMIIIRVNKYKEIQKEKFARDKQIYRQYFAKELNWVDIKKLREEQRLEKEEKRIRKKAEKLQKKEGGSITDLMQIVKEEEEEKKKEIEEKKRLKEEEKIKKKLRKQQEKEKKEKEKEEKRQAKLAAKQAEKDAKEKAQLAKVIPEENVEEGGDESGNDNDNDNYLSKKNTPYQSAKQSKKQVENNDTQDGTPKVGDEAFKSLLEEGGSDQFKLNDQQEENQDIDSKNNEEQALNIKDNQ